MIIQLGNFGGGGGGSVDPSVLSGYCNGGQYNASTQKIELLHDSNVIARIDASSFVIDGMVEDVYLSGTTLVIEFNTAAGKQNIEVPLSSIFDPSNYYTKSEVDTELAKKQPVSGMTAYTTNHDFAAHSGNTDMHTTAEEKAAWNAKQDASAMTNYYTSAQTQSAISGAVLTKQDTLVSGQNIKTINNESLLGSGNITISGGSSSNIVELTQAQYDSLATKDPDTLYIITDAQAINMNDYWTSTQTSSAISGKVDTSAITTAITSASTNAEVAGAKAVYDAIQAGGGGGATYSAGYGIAIDTANTISFNMPITCTTNTNNNITIGNGTNNGIWSLLVGNDMSITNSDAAIGLCVSDMSVGGSSISGNSRGVLIGCTNQIKGGNVNVGGGIAIGDRNQSINGGIAIGTASNASGSSTVAIGFSANATGTTKMNLNNQIKVDTNNQVYISNSANTSTYCVQEKIETTEAALGGLKFVKLTQAQYDNLVTKDADTMYIIVSGS